MNSIRRAITAERKRLLTLSPTSISQEQHASSYSTARSTIRTLKSSKTRAPEVISPAPPPSTTTSSSNDAVRNEPVTWAKPSEIPWQSKVVNSVNLIGRVKIPVQFEASPDGKNWAGTIISQDDGSESSSSLPSFWIPVIFEGDLAHIAMCHLKEKDYVHVAGHLSVDVPPFKLTEVQANVQVMVHSINFVQDSHSKKASTPWKQDRWGTKNSDVAFEQQNQVESSPINYSKEVGRVQIDKFFEKPTTPASWRDLLSNSAQWVDNREKKQKGLLNPKYPDFKHKETGAGLWLNNAPPEVLQGLGLLQTKNDIDPWKHLVENPSEWWDNRLDKKNQKGPDFKNKDSGKGLWLADAPSWASSSLPPLKPKRVDIDMERGWGA